MTVPLITLAQAKAQLVIEDDDRDSEILLKAEEATDIVVDYLKKPDHGWTDRTVPGRVRLAILMVLTSIFFNRGDDAAAADPISKAVVDVLARTRDPTLA